MSRPHQQEMTLPRYFFHLVGASRDADLEGTELHSAHDAKVESIRLACDTVTHAPALLDAPGFRVEVMDDQGEVLFTVDMQVPDGFSERSGTTVSRTGDRGGRV